MRRFAMRKRACAVMVLAALGCHAGSPTKTFPSTSASFTPTRAGSPEPRFEASNDHIAVPAGGVAVRFTIPALGPPSRRPCNSSARRGAHPIAATLWKPDGTFVTKVREGCLEDSLPPGNPTRCTRTLFCPAPVNLAADFVLVIEPGDAGPSEVAAGVSASDPYE